MGGEGSKGKDWWQPAKKEEEGNGDMNGSASVAPN